MANTPDAATTLWALLSDSRKEVRIPPLQRDYAHGRKGPGMGAERAEIVRTRFLKSIDDALTEGSDQLSLDFVFGPEDEDVFEPIDGQQRLTTLFLYHWYLIPNEMPRAPLGRFRYETRASSRDFVRLLADTAAATVRSAVGQGSLSEGMIDLSGFSLRWRDDPTVAGMLVVLDAIHDNWKVRRPEEHTTAWERLTSAEDPAAYFFMPGNSGEGTRQSAYELYIRMNDRGKQLTPFEQFKAWLEEHAYRGGTEGEITGQVKNWPDTEADGTAGKTPRWMELLDTEWTDLFWQHMDDENDLVDEEFLRFFSLIAATEYARSDDDNRGAKGKRDVLDGLFLEDIAQTSLFEKTKCFNDRSLKLAFGTLQALSGEGNRWLSEEMHRCGIVPRTDIGERAGGGQTLLDTVISGNITLLDRLRFYAFAMVIAPHYEQIRNRVETVGKEIVRAVRVIDNVVRNTPELNREEFLRLVPVLGRLTEHLLPEQSDAEDLEVYSTLAQLSREDITRVAGKSGRIAEQILEERRKAGLIEKEPAWEQMLITAEAVPFLRGRVDFLLTYVFGAEKDDDPKNQEKRNRFARYVEIVSGLFQATGRTAFNTDLPSAQGNPGAFVLRRALLALGYFNFQRGGSSWSFCGDHDNPEREREQWYSHGFAGSDSAAHDNELMMRLFEEIDRRLSGSEISKDSVAKALRDLVHAYLRKHPTPGDWRWWYIAYPELIAYAEYCETAWPRETRAYILKKRQLNGRHVELVSYALYRDLKRVRSASGGTEGSQSRAGTPAAAEWDITPFTKVGYFDPPKTSETPCMYLDGYQPAGSTKTKTGGATFYLDVAFEATADSYEPGEDGILGTYTLTFAARDNDHGQPEIPKPIRKGLEDAGFASVSKRPAYKKNVQVTSETWARAVTEAIHALSVSLPPSTGASSP